MVNIISERLIQKYVKFEAYETSMLCANFQKFVQDGYGDVVVEPPSLDLQTVLSKPKSAAGQSATVNIISEPSIKKHVKFVAAKAGERPKASNFRAKSLKIGTWVVSTFLINCGGSFHKLSIGNAFKNKTNYTLYAVQLKK
jgi:hypothetical protein